MTQDESAYRDRPINIDETGKRKWILAKQPKGKWYTRRSIFSYFLLAFLVLAPIVKINGEPFMLFDIINRHFHIFGISIYTQDTNILALMMAVVVVSVVLFTVVYGRIWCGWACPQTLFMEMIFRRIEYLFDGNYRKGNKKSTNSFKKIIKHLVFFVVAFLITNVFVMWIVGPDRLLEIMGSPIRDNLMGFMVMLGLSIFYYWIYAHFREQVCTMICPYGRMQGVLLDSKSVAVIYDFERGEPRGAKAEGDCIDCSQCIRVCPTGIDIKNGTQLECINCTACIDECDSVMRRIKKPEGLIRYDSYEGVTTGRRALGNTRTWAYSAVLLVLFAFLIGTIVQRTDVETSMLRVSGTLYQEVSESASSNMFSVKVINKTKNDIDLTFKLLSHEAGDLKWTIPETKVDGNGSMDAILILTLQNKDLSGKSTPIEFGIFEGDRELERIKSNFIGPTE